jgi:hypothetical protein
MSRLQSTFRAFKKPRVAKIGRSKKEEPATTGRAYSVFAWLCQNAATERERTLRIIAPVIEARGSKMRRCLRSGPGAIRNAEGVKQYDRWQRKPRSTPHRDRADCWTKRDQDVLAVSGVDVENVGQQL